MTEETQNISLLRIASREIRLASRPNGVPTAADFSMASVELDPLQDQQVSVRNLFMSVDPYMRARMNAGKSYIPRFEIGEPLNSGAVGEVIDSRAGLFKPGDVVISNSGWREPAEEPFGGGPVLAITAPTRKFGTFTAVDTLNQSVGSGEIFGLLGPSGAAQLYPHLGA
jgi:hypothetical protein